jgi:hypothetical protein
MKLVAILLVLTIALSACTPFVETRVSSAGGYFGDPMRGYSLASEEITSPELLAAQKSVKTRLAALQFIPSDTPDLYLEVTIAKRPASLALATTGAIGSSVLAPADKKKSSAKCARMEYRLGVNMTRLSDGKQRYYATASEVHCKLSLNEVLPALVDAALADLPKASADATRSYVLKRKLR